VTMQDPPPSNISGTKVETVSHEVHHHIRWDYAIAGIVALYVLVKFVGPIASDDDQEDRADHGGDGDRDLVDVDIQGVV